MGIDPVLGACLSRERLIEEVEKIYEYGTGFTPDMTFGPNRRVGARGAYILTIDTANRKLLTVSDWVDGSPVSSEF